MTDIAESFDNQEPQENEETDDGTNRPLKELVFEVCENLYTNQKKITRATVKEQVGRGSDRDLSRYINDWKESKSMVHQQPEPPTQHGTRVQPEPIKNGSVDDDNIANLVRTSAEQATSMLIANAALATHFYMNPEKLPEDLKQEVEEATANFTQSRLSYSRSIFDPQKLIDQAMEKVE